MSGVTDSPPPKVKEDLEALRDELDEKIPPRTLDRNLLIATWNLRAFGGLTEKWVSGEGDSPKRDLQSIHVIAEFLRPDRVVHRGRGASRALVGVSPRWTLRLHAGRAPPARSEQDLALVAVSDHYPLWAEFEL